MLVVGSIYTTKVPNLKIKIKNIYCDGVLIILKTVITDDFINVYCYSNGYMNLVILLC